MGYVVRSERETGSITYHCPSTCSALEKLRDFQRAKYSDIKITNTNDCVISEIQLESLVALETAG